MSGILANTTATILDKLQGAAADPTKIGTEYMPDVVEVQGVTLTDTSGVELPDGTLGLDANGRLVVHDGDTTGGVDADGLRIIGAMKHTVSDSIASNQFVEIGRCVIPASYVSNSDYLYFTGKIIIRGDLTNYNPAGNAAVLFRLLDANGSPDPDDEPSDGFSVTIATASDLSDYTILEYSGYLSATVSTNLSLMAPASATGTVKLRKIDAGVPADTDTAMAKTTGVGEGIIAYGGAGQFAYISLGIYLPADAATADVTGFIYAASDIRILKVSA